MLLCAPYNAITIIAKSLGIFYNGLFNVEFNVESNTIFAHSLVVKGDNSLQPPYQRKQDFNTKLNLVQVNLYFIFVQVSVPSTLTSRIAPCVDKYVMTCTLN